MKQLIISMLLAACTIVGVGAQDMAELFVKMPDEYTIGLEDAWRKDLVNLYRAGKEAKLQNMMQGASQLMKLTPDYLKIQTSGRSTVELRRLPLVNHTWIICMVTTVSAPVSDSRIHFFAPYRQNGQPKDWEHTGQGNFRNTCASNFWDNISIPSAL